MSSSTIKLVRNASVERLKEICADHGSCVGFSKIGNNAYLKRSINTSRLLSCSSCATYAIVKCWSFIIP